MNTYQGNWTCSSCGGAITELPFEPKSEKGLTCRACYMKPKSDSGSRAPEVSTASQAPDMQHDAAIATDEQEMPPDDFGGAVPIHSTERPTFSGDWTCAGCGTSITSLPFNPRSTENLKCIDCFKKSKQ